MLASLLVTCSIISCVTLALKAISFEAKGGKQLSANGVVNFGQVGPRGTPLKKNISVVDTQGNLPAGFAADVAAATLPPGFSISTKPGKDAAHATLLITFTPISIGTTTGTIIIPVQDTGDYAINLNVQAQVTHAPSAQKLYGDPYITLSLNGQQLSKDYVLDFGQMTPSDVPITKTISLYDSQGSFPVNFFSLDFGAASVPPGYSVNAVLGSDNAHATMTVTFTPDTVGAANGTIVIPVNDGGAFVIALNVNATVLPAADTSVTRIVMARQPAIAGGTRRNGLARVQFTNASTYKESGTTTVTLYASLSDTLDTTDALQLGIATQTIGIKAGRSKSIALHFNYPVPPASGDFHIFSVATGPTLIPADSMKYLSPILQPIITPQINLSGIATESPAFLTRPTTRITVPIENSGNVTAQAKVQMNIYTLPPPSEPGASSSPSLLGTFSRNYSINPGRQAIRTIHTNHPVQTGFEIIAVITAINMPPALAAIDISTLPDSFAVR